MSSWFSRGFGYGLGSSIGRALFGGGERDDERRREAAAREPIQPKTEAEIQADEKRFDAEAKKLDADDAARGNAAGQQKP